MLDYGSLVTIIYHDFLPPSKMGSHVKSDSAHTIIQNTPLSPYTKHGQKATALWFSVVGPVLQFTQPHNPTASHLEAKANMLQGSCVRWLVVTSTPVLAITLHSISVPITCPQYLGVTHRNAADDAHLPTKARVIMSVLDANFEVHALPVRHGQAVSTYGVASLRSVSQV